MRKTEQSTTGNTLRCGRERLAEKRKQQNQRCAIKNDSDTLVTRECTTQEV